MKNKLITVFLTYFIVLNANANNEIRVSDEFLDGLWKCESKPSNTDGLIIESTGEVEHLSKNKQYKYSGKVLAYYISNPKTYSQLNISLFGSYELNDNEMTNVSNIVELKSTQDGLGLHSAEFLSSLSVDLKKTVTAKLTLLNQNEFEALVYITGDTERCHRIREK